MEVHHLIYPAGNSEAEKQRNSVKLVLQTEIKVVEQEEDLCGMMGYEGLPNHN